MTATLVANIARPISSALSTALSADTVGLLANYGRLGESWSIDTAFPAGVAGGYYDLTDTSLLFQDANGITPVSADGDPVALIVSARENHGSEIVTNQTFDSSTGWTVNSGWEVTGGKAVATNASAALRWVTTLVENRIYVVEFDCVVTSGTLNVNCGAAANTAITTTGHYRLYLVCGGAPTGGLYFNTSSFTGTVDNVSLKLCDPFVLRQTDTSKRGTYKAPVGGSPYVDCPATCALPTANPVTFTLPAYCALAVSRNTESGPLTLSGFGYPQGIQIATTNGTYGMVLALAKSGVFSNVAAPAGAFPPNVPAVIDCKAVAGETTSWINGGSRYVDDHNSGNSGGLVARANTWTGSESYADSYFGINVNGGAAHTGSQCRFYGGFVMLDNPTDANRTGMHGWLMEKSGIGTLSSLTYDLFVVAGQSNAMGVGSIATTESVTLGHACEFKARGGVHPLADPVQQEGTSSAAYGSAWPAFCNDYYAATGRRVAIVGAAASGEGLVFTSTPRGGWSGSQLVPALADKLSAARAKLPGATVRGVLWCGGEQDALSVITVSSYKAALVAFRDALRTATGISSLPLLILSIDNKVDVASQYSIMRQAQSEAASENDGIDLVMEYQGFINAGKTADGVHWNQTALNEAGSLAAAACAALWP